MTGPVHDRAPYEDRESLIAQIGALRDELDRLRERVSTHPHDIAIAARDPLDDGVGRYLGVRVTGSPA